MMRRLALILLFCAAPMSLLAAVVQVSTGEHTGFTRLVLQYDAPVAWTMGRTPDGYELRLPGGAAHYDLSKVFNQIGKSRLAAIWADPDSGALHVGVACACYAMPFEFRPGIVVIDLHDGAPPKGSSFEQPLDGGAAAELAAPPIIRPRTRPGVVAGPAYDWTNLAFGSQLQTPEPRAPTAPKLANLDPLLDPLLEPLRQSLIVELSRGASEGIVDMAKPKATKGATPAVTMSAADAAVQFHLGAAPDLVIRQKGEGGAPTTAQGADCVADDRLDLVSWAANTPIAEQIGPALTGLIGEFDRPDPAAIKRAVRFDLYLGFGAEARALMRSFPTEDADTALWQSMAHILDGEADPHPAFTGMAACNTAASLWAILADPAIVSIDAMAKSAILRGFSALPTHLRRQLGPVLIDRFLTLNDISTSTALHDAILRAPGAPGPEVVLMQANMDAAMGHPAVAEARLEPLANGSGPATAVALVALVEQRASLGQTIDFAKVQVLEEYLKERRGGAEEAPFQHALIVAQGASGDFDSAFASLPKAPDAAALLWQTLAQTGSDSALLAHATLPETDPLPEAAKPVASLIADRLLTLGLAAEAGRWLHLGDQPPPILLARVALAQGDPQTALTLLQGLDAPLALPPRAEALRQLGADQAAAAIYGALDMPDQQWNAVGRAHDWQTLATQGPKSWQSAAALLLAPGATTQLPLGPLARDAALLTQSAATRDALAALLDSVKSPIAATQ